MEIVLEGIDISNEYDVYFELWKQEPEFGPYFGFNIHALWDYIGLLEGDSIVWNNSELSRDRLGDDFYKIISLFNDWNKNISTEDKKIKLYLR
ncbi:Barstar (barnase inhibitor) [Pasteurella testudinis DSM 23072]|uniref:Barstar (Barnase inhibitor) n=1 Tax=Pasteurella testudinis DSM 23072 TaxID=1122938 RepID=A0A1W1UGV2_9PAST|nr:barstar family protein [Pasteurella testudinis]SMB80004.1 Barstar (barnase inhibitor) [Pasteurella testudinis DSM 23072]SUB50622.1 Barstar (barnase inhibitor) [Pasteurella testudinis]